MSDIQELTDLILKFRKERDWKKFHNLKDMSLSLVLEAAEVMEHFQWKSKNEIDKYIKTHKQKISEELSDVLYWIFLMSYDLKIDIKQEFIRKMKITERKYPVSRAKGNNKKYTE